MNWKKLGRIYEVKNSNPYLLSHASNPLAIHLENDVYRIYYNGRDEKNRSSVSYVDINIIEKEIVNDPKFPILTYRSSSFYSHGISIGNFWKKGQSTYIGFMGWQNNEGSHWRGDIGAFSLDSSVDPFLLLGMNEEDKISLSYPWIIFEEGMYKMWYGSTVTWNSSNGEMIHVIKYAESSDLLTWQLFGECLPLEIGVQQAFSRPTVKKINNKYHMWYSYRSGDGTPYRIGHAESENGKVWNKLKPSINVSDSGWDSEMICYPYVFEHDSQTYMLYNGNGFGKSGFGIAILNH